MLPKSDRLPILPLDITDSASLTQAVAEADDIDVLVNNAGFGAPAPIELTEREMARALFDTNTLDTLAMVRYGFDLETTFSPASASVLFRVVRTGRMAKVSIAIVHPCVIIASNVVMAHSTTCISIFRDAPSLACIESP